MAKEMLARDHGDVSDTRRLKHVDEALWESMAMGKVEFLKRADTSAFNWRATHPHFGSVIHAILFGRIGYDENTSEDSEDECKKFSDIVLENDTEQRLETLRLAVENGADPYIPAPMSCQETRTWNCGSEEKTLEISFAGKSAIQCLWATERVIKSLASEKWNHELSIINAASEILSTAPTHKCSHKEMSFTGLLEAWENVLNDKNESNITIVVNGTKRDASSTSSSVLAPSTETGQVQAHKVVLCAASPVLRAMLSATFREGSRQEITLEDCSLSAVRLMLSVLYTGSFSEAVQEPSVSTLLDALTLGHRWQVLYVVDMLCPVIAQRLSLKSLEEIMEVALRLQLSDLLAKCRNCISKHVREIRAKTRQGTECFQSNAVRDEVSHILKLDGTDGVVEAPKKRRRLLF